MGPLVTVRLQLTLRQRLINATFVKLQLTPTVSLKITISRYAPWIGILGKHNVVLNQRLTPYIIDILFKKSMQETC